MAFERAQLIPMAAGGKAPAGQGNKPADGGFVVTFNPTTLKVSYTSSLEGGGSRGKKQSQYIGKQSTELVVELIFDTTEVSSTSAPRMAWGDEESRQQAARCSGDVDVRIFTLRVAALMAPKDPKADKPAPTRVQFVWGAFLFEGVVSSLTETLELFSAEGIPLRASLQLTMTEDSLEFRRSGAQGGRVKRLAIPAAGGSAAEAAREAGLDPQEGKALAAQNGLDDLRAVPAQKPLVVPAARAERGASSPGGLGAAASASFGSALSGGFSAGGSVTLSGGFGGGAGLGVTIGGGGGFGLEVGVSAAAGFSASIGGGASAGLNVGLAAGFSASGGVAGIGASAVALLGAGPVGGPSSGGAPGAQAVMRPDGRISLAPAPRAAPLPPPQATRAHAAPTARALPTLAAPRAAEATPAHELGSAARAQGGTVVASTVGLPGDPAASARGLPALPPSAAPGMRGAFQGISGVPLKRMRFAAAAPVVRPLAYRRLASDEACLAAEEPHSTAETRTRAVRPCRCPAAARGGRCACGH
jgi:hypothetical protein